MSRLKTFKPRVVSQMTYFGQIDAPWPNENYGPNEDDVYLMVARELINHAYLEYDWVDDLHPKFKGRGRRDWWIYKEYELAPRLARYLKWLDSKGY